jgi:HK97 family phage major capsid protein
MDELLKKLAELQSKMDAAIGDAAVVKAVQDEIKALREDYVKMKQEMGELKAEKPNKKASVPGLEFEKDKFSLLRAINAIATKSWKNAGFELEVFQNTTDLKKTMSTETDTAGGYVVPIQVLGDFIEMFRANLVTKQLGATYIEGLNGSPVEIPGQAGGASVYWLGEDNPSGITASDISLKQSQMTPHGAAALVKLSNRLLRMSNPSIEGLVRQDVAFAMAEAVDLAAIRGIGANGQPLGLMNVGGVLTHDLVGITKKVEVWPAMYDIENKLAEANSLKGRLGWLFHPRVKRNLAQARVGSGFAAEDGDGDFVQNPITQNQLASYIGYPFQTTTNMAITTSTSPDESEMLFGNWAELIIGVWQGLTIMASQEASDAFAKNQTWIRFVQEVDCLLRHPESFCIGQHLNVETIA